MHINVIIIDYHKLNIPLCPALRLRNRVSPLLHDVHAPYQSLASHEETLFKILET